MTLDFETIAAYQNHQMPDPNAWYYQKMNGPAPVSQHRQEICAALCRELSCYDAFPLWNKELITLLFNDLSALLSDFILKPIIGSHPSLDAAVTFHEQHPYLLIDLLNIADYTQSVKEMTYILHNLCHMHILRYLFQQRCSKPHSYIEQLEYRFFVEGTILYLAWNDDYHHYVFAKKAYQARRMHAFALMEKAMQVRDEKTQQMILTTLETADLWNRFSDVAGMLTCDELLQSGNTDAFLCYVSQGYSGSFLRIATS